jgi:hypothetical protein
MIHELVYYSIANRDLTEANITDILNHSRRFNKDNNITGCLLFYNNEFIQFLEGDSKSVKDLYANIAKDKRHSNIVLLTRPMQRKGYLKPGQWPFIQLIQWILPILKKIFLSIIF